MRKLTAWLLSLIMLALPLAAGAETLRVSMEADRTLFGETDGGAGKVMMDEICQTVNSLAVIVSDQGEAADLVLTVAGQPVADVTCVEENGEVLLTSSLLPGYALRLTETDT